MTNLAGRAGKVRDAALAIVQTPDGGVRVEDYLTAQAAAVGEAALGAAGFDVVHPTLVPGSAVFFDAVNEVLTGDPLPADGAGPARCCLEWRHSPRGPSPRTHQRAREAARRVVNRLL